jgi:hypothetical protein
MAELFGENKLSPLVPNPKDRAMLIDEVRNAISANPQALALLGAILAATVAFVSFSFNYRATLRNQSDTQFFEALKRFGDASPSLRNSAVGLLVQIAGSGASRWWYEPERRRPYFTTTLNQFVTALALETEPVVAATIVRGLKQLAPLSPHTVISAIGEMNQTFQSDLVRVLAAYSASDASTPPEPVSQMIDRIASATPYTADVLRNLIKRKEHVALLARLSRRSSFADLVESERLQFDTLAAEERALHRRESFDKIGITARRLNESADVLAFALYLVQPPAALRMYVDYMGERRAETNRDLWVRFGLVDLNGAFLADVDLSTLDLANVYFKGAQLDGADLSRTNLQGLDDASLERADLQRANLGFFWPNGALDNARLFGAAVYGRFGTKSNIWCSADFSSDTGEIDQRLLVAFCGRDVFERLQELGGDPMTFLRSREGWSDEIKVHSTVLEFLAGKAFDDRDDPPDPLSEYIEPVFMNGIIPSWILRSGFFFTLVVGIILWRSSHRLDFELFTTVSLGCVLFIGWWRVEVAPQISRMLRSLYFWRGSGRGGLIRLAIRASLERLSGLRWGVHEVGPPMSRIILSLTVGLGLILWQGARYLLNPEVTQLTLVSLGLCICLDAIMNMHDRAKRTRYPLWE